MAPRILVVLFIHTLVVLLFNPALYPDLGHLDFTVLSRPRGPPLTEILYTFPEISHEFLNLSRNPESLLKS